MSHVTKMSYSCFAIFHLVPNLCITLLSAMAESIVNGTILFVIYLFWNMHGKVCRTGMEQ